MDHILAGPPDKADDERPHAANRMTGLRKSEDSHAVDMPLRRRMIAVGAADFSSSASVALSRFLSGQFVVRFTDELRKRAKRKSLLVV
ncbi:MULTISPECIES: hypothetical protein [Sinorhizobium]|uniref:hypothetical protein n=1 Tax=Sinorhizobium TaxID=28105 RepID=UPI0024B1A1D0|nr:hypothetical protein [Sinorhizobium terangae]WFU51917.1 hypothetical protein QA637_28835 [Sinorhizobium terangae]